MFRSMPISLPSNFVQNDGSDWSLNAVRLIPALGRARCRGRPRRAALVHLQYPNRRTTIGKINTKTGEVKLFKLAAPNGLAAQTHGMTRDAKGIIVSTSIMDAAVSVASIQTEKIDVYLPPQGMSPTGGATTVDHDGKGRIWAFRTGRALRSICAARRRAPDSSPSPTRPRTVPASRMERRATGTATAVAEMTLDIIGKGDEATGKSQEVKLAAVKEEMNSRHSGGAAHFTSLQPA